MKANLAGGINMVRTKSLPALTSLRAVTETIGTRLLLAIAETAIDVAPLKVIKASTLSREISLSAALTAFFA
jgi:hypothetical protein